MWNIRALALTIQKLLARLKFQRGGQNDREDKNNIPTPDLRFRGHKFLFKKSSPILLGQVQPNLTQSILGWTVFKNSENTLTNFKNLFLQNHWANFNQTWHKASMGEIQVFCFLSNDRLHSFPRGNNYQVAKIHWKWK